MDVLPGNLAIAVIGLGYVGLPLAVEFGKKFKVVGYDISLKRIRELRSFKDDTGEVSESELRTVVQNSNQIKGVFFTDDSNWLRECQIKIISVPTPVDIYNNPDLSILIAATQTVAKQLRLNDIVIYESTVFPGCTEEVCVPLLEKYSNFKFNEDFFCGYSPERINPGDKVRTLTNIVKVTSGSNTHASKLVDELYKTIIPAGTFNVSSIKIAEAAKVIENAQRDINIAFVNELSKIFSLLEIDTHKVLEAASTKWNFLDFKPGLVGGHCIGVDPYYLAQKAISVGYYPEIILSGRKINDSMGQYVADRVLKLMIKKSIDICKSRVLILGATFKENCKDIRNTKVADIIIELQQYNIQVAVHDPWISLPELVTAFGLADVFEDQIDYKYDAIILAVAHQGFKDFDFHGKLKQPSVLYDVKGILETQTIDGRL